MTKLLDFHFGKQIETVDRWPKMDGKIVEITFRFSIYRED